MISNRLEPSKDCSDCSPIPVLHYEKGQLPKVFRLHFCRKDETPVTGPELLKYLRNTYKGPGAIR